MDLGRTFLRPHSNYKNPSELCPIVERLVTKLKSCIFVVKIKDKKNKLLLVVGFELLTVIFGPFEPPTLLFFT